MNLDVPGVDQAIDLRDEDGQRTGQAGFTTQWTAWVTKVTRFVVGRSRSGTTAQRPTDNLEVGTPYWDTTLGKPIWLKTVSPAAWVDATGAGV